MNAFISSMMFFPSRAFLAYPEDYGLQSETVELVTADGVRLYSWYLPAREDKGTLLYIHGNAGNISHRLFMARGWVKRGFSCFLLDYRGYGKSEGSPNEAGLYKDLQAAYAYLVDERGIPSEHIVAFGESLGTAAAVQLAAKEKLGGLIVEGGFSRGRDMAKRIYPFLPAFLFSDSFNSLERIPKVTAPILFIHSRNDEVVPFALAKRLYAAANRPKYFSEILGGHNTAFLDSSDLYRGSIKSFISQLPAKKDLP